MEGDASTYELLAALRVAARVTAALLSFYGLPRTRSVREDVSCRCRPSSTQDI